MFLTNTQVLRLCKAFANNSSANVKLSKTQFHIVEQSIIGFLGRLLGSLLKNRLFLLGNVLKPLAESISMPLGITTAASATDAASYS